MHAVGAGAGLIGVTQSQNDQVVEYGYILRVCTVVEFPDVRCILVLTEEIYLSSLLINYLVSLMVLPFEFTCASFF